MIDIYALENISAHAIDMLKEINRAVVSEMATYSAHPDTIPGISPVILSLEGREVFGWTLVRKRKFSQSIPTVFYSIDNLPINRSALRRNQYEYFLIVSSQLQDFQNMYDEYCSIVKAVKALS